VSLATIYNLFGTRDQLIVAAVQRWLDVNAYEVMSPPQSGETPYETLVRVLRTVFEPWERRPEKPRNGGELNAGEGEAEGC
jgi:AcrR family transcriptional regulator